MNNIKHLAEKNEALLKKINFDPINEDPFELDNPVTFKESGLFPDHAVMTIFNESCNSTDTSINKFNKFQVPKDIGMLLIRPDMLHVTSEVEDFVRKDYRILESTITEVNPDMYWAMYEDAITHKESFRSRFTRASVFIGSACRLIVLKSKINLPESSVADELVLAKGRQGEYQQSTFRGDIVYRSAVSSGFNTLKDKTTALAVDPFGAYRKIIDVDKSGKHCFLNYPLLFFTGVGIHIPDSTEIDRDLSLFVSKELLDDRPS